MCDKTLLEQFIGCDMEHITKFDEKSKRNFLEYAALFQQATNLSSDHRHEFRRLIAIAAYLNVERVQPHLRPVAAGDKVLKAYQMEKFNRRNGDEYETYRAFVYKLLDFHYKNRVIRTLPTGHPDLKGVRGMRWSDLPLSFPRINYREIERWIETYTDYVPRTREFRINIIK